MNTVEDLFLFLEDTAIFWLDIMHRRRKILVLNFMEVTEYNNGILFVLFI